MQRNTASREYCNGMGSRAKPGSNTTVSSAATAIYLGARRGMNWSEMIAPFRVMTAPWPATMALSRATTNDSHVVKATGGGVSWPGMMRIGSASTLTPPGSSIR